MLIIPLHLPNGAKVIQLSYCCRLLLCVMYHPCCSIKKNSILFHYSARPNDYSSICACCTVILILTDFPFLIKHIGFNTVVDKLILSLSVFVSTYIAYLLIFYLNSLQMIRAIRTLKPITNRMIIHVTYHLYINICRIF